MQTINNSDVTARRLGWLFDSINQAHSKITAQHVIISSIVTLLLAKSVITEEELQQALKHHQDELLEISINMSTDSKKVKEIMEGINV